MRDDLTTRIFEGVTRMQDARTRSILESVKEMLDTRLANMPHGPAGPVGTPGLQGERGPEGVPGRDGRDAMPMPGPRGEAGEKGLNGRDGKDGKDSDLTKAELDAAITKAVKETVEWWMKSMDFDLNSKEWKLGDHVIKRVPFQIYRGVYLEGQQYEPGDSATFGGSVWHCNSTTSEKPGQNGDWTLAVKHGRDK